MAAGPGTGIDPAAVTRRARFIRRETIRLIGIAGTGHYTSVFSAAEILAALYSGVMRLQDDPDAPDRDRLILSKGHCAVGVYPLLAERGYLPREVLDGYTRLGNPLGDHPDMRLVPGIDFSSGSLGHGLSIGTGMAAGARLRGFGDVRVFVLLGDQELNEGQVWEAAGAASHFGLGNVCAIVDRNGMGLDGETEDVMRVEPIAEKFRAFGWDAREVDGHDVPALLDAFDALPPASGSRPQVLVAQTVKGKGVTYMEATRTWHLGYLAPDDAAAALAEIGDE